MLRLGLAIIVLCAGVSGVWIERSTWRPEPEVAFLAVGQGDCTVIRFGNSAILVDVGPRNPYTDAGERIVAPELRRMGVTSVPLILLTHPDSDHIGGIKAMMRAYPRARVATPAHFRANPNFVTALREAGVDADRVDWLEKESLVSFGPFRLRLASPDADPTTSTNDGSLFVRVQAPGYAVVLSGDATIPVENAMARRGAWNAEILQLGHHGSRTSTGAAWLSAVKPELAVASAGRDNRYGHPHASVVNALEERGIRLLRTDRHGTITVRPSARGYEVVVSR
ncbi:MAG: ComEC/Rec2 family competence protein [Fimbriimonadaceae bacterium]